MSLAKLTLPSLRQLSRQCGLATTGTKPILIHNLTNLPLSPVASTSSRAIRSRRICSIDMGIRNLAFCMLDAPIPAPTPTIGSLLALKAWQRVEIASKPGKDIEFEEVSAKKGKESFDPPIYAALAHRFLVDTILPFKPDVVLIERQRYRSAGSPIIQEWTVRVNAFEAMLWATLHTLRAEGRWSGHAETVSPARVASFWTEDDTSSVTTKKDSKMKVKKVKIAAAAELLSSDGFDASAVGDLQDAFLDKALGKRRRAAADGVAKIDDLADCLLQGVAWQRWQEARHTLVHQGWEALLKG